MTCGCPAPPAEGLYGLVDDASELLLELDRDGRVTGAFPHQSPLVSVALCGGGDLETILPGLPGILVADRAEVVRREGLPTSIDIPRTELRARIAPHGEGALVLLRRTVGTTTQELVPIDDDTFWALFDAAPLPMAVVLARTATDDRPTRYNRRFTEVFGYTHEDVPTVAHWWPLAYPDPEYRRKIHDEWYARLQADAARSTITTIDAKVTCKDGSIVAVEFFAALVGVRNVVVFIPRPAATDADVAAGADASLLAMCAWCKRVRDVDADWEPVEQLLARKLGLRPTHGICPDCLGQYFKRGAKAD
jgi:PAS domain-containing protein